MRKIISVALCMCATAFSLAACAHHTDAKPVTLPASVISAKASRAVHDARGLTVDTVCADGKEVTFNDGDKLECTAVAKGTTNKVDLAFNVSVGGGDVKFTLR